ncbi:MAG: aspartate--tRNA ligase [Pseudomonadota bacterium]|jgi:aspartyl-tRNA synthetase
MTAAFLQQHKRTRLCGEFRDREIGSQAVVYGWVQSYRDHGGVIFVDLRDRTGIVQLRFEPSHNGGAAHELANRLRTEWVIGARGEVISRGANINPKIPTGAIEILVDEVAVLNEARTPPFEIKDDIDTNETTRLTYRYLDLRRPQLSANLALRSRVNQITRRYFCDDNAFLELETPILAKSTPEGARDYLVPSRVHPGEFYALPQSPQQFKQLFMMSGMDRYMQICRCFRDEDLRADRQPEFTQLDLELSFVDVSDIRTLLDGYVATIWKDVHGVEVQTPIPSITWQEAMDRYGIDRPDLRFGLPLSDLTATLSGRATFRVFTDALDKGGIVKALAIPDGSALTRKDLDKTLPAEAAPYGARGVAWARIAEDGAWSGPVAKGLDDDLKAELLEKMGVGPGALILFVADKASVVNASLARLRQVVGERLGLIPEGTYSFVWVVDFPMFEYDEGEGRWYAMHHPFTSPKDEDVAMLDTDPGKVRAKAYDLVLNGIELGGGSIRIHRGDVQDRVFALLGLEEAERREKFGFFIDALGYGTPPHGGIALGLDRLMMLLCGAESLRDVIAFPKTQKASCLMTDSPSQVSAQQLEELHVRTVVAEPAS